MLRSRRRRLRLLLVGAAVLLLLGLVAITQSTFAVHAAAPCAQFIQHQHPSSQILAQVIQWGRRNVDPLTIEAHAETPHGPLQLYHVTCPVGTEQLKLYGFRLGDGMPGDAHTTIAEDLGPERPIVDSHFIQTLSGHSGPRANGAVLTYALGRIVDPSVQRVEATLDTGEVVAAERSAQVFVVLTSGQHTVCEYRAVDAQDRVLERIAHAGDGCLSN